MSWSPGEGPGALQALQPNTGVCVCVCARSVCSAGGVVTVVTTPGVTWPSVDPDRTRLLDPRCRPRETDGSRVLFEFQLDSCGTRAMVTTPHRHTRAFLL